MKNRLGRALAGLSLAAAAVTATVLTDELVATPQGDTAWGAPATTSTPAIDDTTIATPLDTAWG